MKRWIDKIWLLSWKELLLLVRTRKGILLFIVIIGLGGIAQALQHLGALQAPTWAGTLFLSYSNFLQLFPLALAVVLADAISGEKERGTWNFFFSKPFTSSQTLISKVLVNYFSAVIAIVLMWTGVLLFAQATITDHNWQQAIFPLVVIIAVTFNIVALEIMISACYKSVAIVVLLIVVAWIGLMLMNIATPIARGFIAPWAANSYQTSIVERFLDAGFPVFPFDDVIGAPSLEELCIAVLLPLLQGLLFCGIAWIAMKRSARV